MKGVKTQFKNNVLFIFLIWIDYSDEQDTHSPAIRLKKRNSFDIDIVPGIILDGWPEVCKGRRPVQEQKTVYHVVAKCHHSGKYIYLYNWP